MVLQEVVYSNRDPVTKYPMADGRKEVAMSGEQRQWVEYESEEPPVQVLQIPEGKLKEARNALEPLLASDETFKREARAKAAKSC